jgi:hypothetical protein
MSDRHDPRIMALIVELSESSPEAPTFMEIEDRATEPIRGGPVRAFRPVWVAAGAALLVLLLVGVPLLFFGSGDGVVADQTTTTVGSTTSVAPSMTVAPTIVPSMVDAWQRVGGVLMGPVVGTSDMTVVGSRLFVVGFDPGEDDLRQNGVIFASDDGVNWVRLAENDSALTLGTVLMYSVTDGGPGLVAVGIGCEDETEQCRPHATVWTSVDGTSWTRSPEDATVFGGGATQTSDMVGITDTSHGLIATGSVVYWTVDDEGVTNLVTIHPAAWISDDGIIWERVWEGAGFSVEPEEFSNVRVSMVSIVEGPDGQLVGVGATLNENGDSIATVWTSGDGRQWERVEMGNAVSTKGTAMLDVALGEHGYVAVGTAGGTNAAIWQSADGATWTRATTAAQSFDGIGSLNSVAALDAGYVTVGPQGFIYASGGWVTVWTSPDGVTWDRVQSITEGYASGVAVVDGGIAVSGGMPYDNDYHAAVWVGPRFDPDAPPPEPPPTPEPAPEAAPTGIAAIEEGMACDDVATEGFTYREAVSYWVRYELTEEFDLDVDGAPCAEAYTDAEVTGLFGEPDALAVHLIEHHPTGTFTATGPAVDAGLVCPEGTIGYTPNPDVDTPGVHWRWEDEFICGDGTGTFLLGVDVYIEDSAPMFFGAWNIVTGTGNYSDLQGGGATDSDGGEYDTSIGRLWTATNNN